ncbi:type II toxin-antitoxin system Phd/YefM family antitoxin [Fluviispira vulneris]|uniref:type II toxin-antitoxin system Phd/YefM family antitoxin n=1 Tax=Fluviispira vulneris TaxID=2763012 RepID=UPI001645B099|nr:type II toxin-antitoxin system Phd/YefM family antitoxin [Fluviispira vulneris]
MHVINMHEAKTNLSRLIEEAITDGVGFIIAKAGKPLVTVEPIKEEKRKIVYGLMKGKIKISDDFDAPCDEINNMFYGDYK